MRRSVLLTAMLVLTCTVAWGCFAVTAFAAGDSSEGACQHKFDKANVCTACGYEKSGTVTLKAKKLAYVNQKTWIRLKAPKKGFVTLKYKNAADEAESITLQVYNASKKKFKYMDVRTNEKGHMFFPVDKATYYLRLKDPTSAAVKYTFKAVKIPPASGIDKARGKKQCARALDDQRAQKCSPDEAYDAAQMQRGDALRQQRALAQADAPAQHHRSKRHDGHHAEAADLDGKKNHAAAEERPVRRRIHDDKAGYADGARRGKQRGQGIGHFAGDGRNGKHEQQRHDQDTAHDQNGTQDRPGTHILA